MERFVTLLRFGVDKSRLARFTLRLGGPTWLVLFVGIYALAFLRPFPLLAWYKFPKSTFASITHYSYLAAIGLELAGLGLVWLCRQIWAVARERPGRYAASLILAGWLSVSAMLLLTYPGQSADLGDYVFRAHMLTHLGKNPMTVPPSEVIAYDDNPYIGWYWTVDPYGPVWHWLAGSVHVIAGEDILANLLAFKALAILATGASGGLVYAILRQISPRHAVAGMALWLWNPLVLNEGALHGHNDLVLVALVLAGLWLVLRGRQTFGVIVLLVAGLVKANAWMVVPVVAVWILRQSGWRKALSTIVPAVLAGALMIWLAYLPFGGWIRVLELARERSWWPTNTWTAVIFFTLRDRLDWPHELVVKVVIGSATLLFAIVSIILMVKVRNLLTGVWAVLLSYLLIGCHWFQPWYATWLIALTAIVVNRRLAAYASILTWFMLLHPIAVQYLVPQFDLPPGGRDIVMATTTLLMPQIMALRLINIHSSWPDFRGPGPRSVR